MTKHFLIVFVSLAACGSEQHPAPVAADPHAAAVDDIVGAWQGQVIGTPLGDFPFAIAFDREASGDIHGRADNGGGMYLDFRFHKVGPMWTLTEEGALPDVGTQTHTLVPAAAGADGPRWVDRDDPGYVEIAVAVAGDDLVLTAKVHGEAHAVFRMHRG